MGPLSLIDAPRKSMRVQTFLEFKSVWIEVWGIGEAVQFHTSNVDKIEWNMGIGSGNYFKLISLEMERRSWGKSKYHPSIYRCG